MKHILEAGVMNGFRSKKPVGFYNFIKGHTGYDLNYHFEPVPSPVSGKVTSITHQVEMGNCIYIDDIETGLIHVFGHMDSVKVGIGDRVNKNDILGISGNSGHPPNKPKGVYAPHLHYEGIAIGKLPAPYADLYNPIMTRSLNGYVGVNIDVMEYDRRLYGKYRFDLSGNELPAPLAPERPLNHK